MQCGFQQAASVTPGLQRTVLSDGFVMKAGNEFKQEPARNACEPQGGFSPQLFCPRLAVPSGCPFLTGEKVVVSAHPPGHLLTDESQAESG